MSSLLKQPAQSMTSVPDAVVDLHVQHATKRTEPMLEELNSALLSVATGISEVFLVIDALNELVSPIFRSKPFATGRCLEYGAFRRRLRNFPFYDYAAKYWGHHARGSQTCNTLLQFWRKENEAEAADQADNLGRTPLCLAVGGLLPNPGIVQLLLKKGVNVNVQDNEGRTPMAIAETKGDKEMVERLARYNEQGRAQGRS